MYQQYSTKQLLLVGKASEVKKAINSIASTQKKNETLQQYLLQRPKMSVVFYL